MTIQELMALLGEGLGDINPKQFRTAPFIPPGQYGSNAQGPSALPNAFDVQGLFGIAPQSNNEPVAKNKSSQSRPRRKKNKDRFLEKVGKPVNNADEYGDVLKYFDLEGIDAGSYGGGPSNIGELTPQPQGIPNNIPTEPNYSIPGIDAPVDNTQNPSPYGTIPPPPIRPYITDEQAQLEAQRRIDEIYGPNLSREGLVNIPSHGRWSSVLDTALKMALAYAAGENVGATGAGNVIQQATRPQRYQQMIQSGTDIEREKLEKRRASEQEEEFNSWARNEEYSDKEENRALIRKKDAREEKESAAGIRASEAQSKLYEAQAGYQRERADIERAEIEAETNAKAADITAKLRQEATKNNNEKLKLEIDRLEAYEKTLLDEMKGLTPRNSAAETAHYEAKNKELAAVRKQIIALGRQYGITGQSTAKRYSNVSVDKERVITKATEIAVQNGASQNDVNADAQKVRSGQMTFEEFRKKYGI